jgi:hypothetical protein
LLPECSVNGRRCVIDLGADDKGVAVEREPDARTRNSTGVGDEYPDPFRQGGCGKLVALLAYLTSVMHRVSSMTGAAGPL